MTTLRRMASAVVLLFTATNAGAEQCLVAVAANFASPLQSIADEFAKTGGHRVQISSGSSGKLYSQIVNGAPFDVFLSADAEHPRKLVAAGNAVDNSRFTYAIGRLVLWSATDNYFDSGPGILKNGKFKYLAIANPGTAPYGAAARQVMQQLGVWDSVRPRLVQGESIGQTFQFVQTGNAELGFVALSQLADRKGGSRWLVPGNHHEPITQEAVLLDHGKGNPAALALLQYLKGPARPFIEQAGYALPARDD
jgi:molybdate transport system substrate-binding protein